MKHIYQAWYICKSVKPTDVPWYNDVILGLSDSSDVTDIIVKSTVGNFVVGKMYYIGIMEVENNGDIL